MSFVTYKICYLLVYLLLISAPLTQCAIPLTSSEHTTLRKLLITDYLHYYKQNRFTQPKLILRFNQNQPGLGDRLNGLVSAYLLALVSQRILVLDWEVPYSVFDYFRPKSMPLLPFDARKDNTTNRIICSNASMCHLHDLSAVLSSVQNVEYEYCLPATDLKKVASYALRYPKLKFSQNLLQNDQALIQYINKNDTSQLLSDILSTIIQPAQNIQTVLKTYKKQLSIPYIAVHARLGSGVGETGPRFESAPPLEAIAKCYVEAALRIVKRRKQFGEKNIALYLATDTSDFRNIFEKELYHRDSQIKLIKTKQFEPVHTATCARKDQSECLLTIVELVILAQAKGIVANKSSYSAAAAILGNIRIEERVTWDRCRKAVAAPKKGNV